MPQNMVKRHSVESPKLKGRYLWPTALCAGLLALGIVIVVIAEGSRAPDLARLLGGMQVLLSIGLWGLLITRKPRRKKVRRIRR